MKRILPLILTLMLLFAGCAVTPDTSTASPSVELTAETAETPSDLQNASVDTPIVPHPIEPTPESPPDEQPETLNSAPAAPIIEPSPAKPKNEELQTQTIAQPKATVKPTFKPQHTPPSSTPSVTLVIIVPTLEPEPTPKPTAKPTQQPTSSPEPPQSTKTPVVPPEEPPAQPEKTEMPTAGYTDATHLCSAFMDAINAEKEANGATAGSLDSRLCSIAQDRARQMAQACKASHIGSGYPETVGAMGSEGGVTNRGRNSVHHSLQLMGCTSFGVGVAIGSDGMYYYSIIGG